MKKTYWTVNIYYGGDRRVVEVFRTKDEAEAFFNVHDICNRPEMMCTNSFCKIEWAENRIAVREMITE